jgi:hypothetical protein
MRSARVLCAAVAAVLIMLIAPAASARTTGSSAPTAAMHLPVYAYFYQWFERGSWDRAKQDYPLIGRYSSDDPHVLRGQVEEAKAAGIDGFLTSWKSTEALNRRLELLLQISADLHFDVGVVYEALDFDRRPLPIRQVRADLALLVNRWGTALHSAFGRPLIVWTGTNEYTPAQVAGVHAMLAGRAYLLAASKSVSDYEKLAGIVDGEAYYWSSSNPRSPSTGSKLDAFAAAVHSHHQLWLAPAAPGFDGRTLGHTRIIDRDGGSTFERSLDLATHSSPDALGVISWNEWSENTYIEPGRRYGSEELHTLRDYLAALNGSRDTPNRISGQVLRSSSQSGWTGLRAAAILVVLTGIGIVVLGIVSRRNARSVPRDVAPDPDDRAHRRAEQVGPLP